MMQKKITLEIEYEFKFHKSFDFDLGFEIDLTSDCEKEDADLICNIIKSQLKKQLLNEASIASAQLSNFEIIDIK